MSLQLGSELCSRPICVWVHLPWVSARLTPVSAPYPPEIPAHQTFLHFCGDKEGVLQDTLVSEALLACNPRGGGREKWPRGNLGRVVLSGERGRRGLTGRKQEGTLIIASESWAVKGNHLAEAREGCVVLFLFSG
jgi:hypothetical protein